MDCALCSELRGNRLILEDEYSFCVVCKWPLKKGHVLVLPKRHVVELNKLNEEESKSFLSMAEKMTELVQKMYGNKAIVLQNGSGHRTQAHLHFHVLPSNGGLRELVGSYEGIPERSETSDEKMSEMREEIVRFMRKD